MLGGERRGDALVRRRPIIHDQHTAAAAGIGHRFPLRRFNPDVARGHRAHAQLIGHHLEPRQRAHARDQRQFRDRLGKKIVGAGFEPAHLVGRLIERGDHDHRNVVGGRIALEPPAHFEAVHVGHHDVEQDEIAFGALADQERVLAAHRRDHVEILRRQPRFQELDVRGHIVDDQNARGHELYLRIAQKVADSLDEFAD
jgi:hypothetical protein